MHVKIFITRTNKHLCSTVDMIDHLWDVYKTKANSRVQCALQRPNRGQVVCISSGLFGFRGRVGSGVFVLKVAGDCSSLIL